MSDASDWFNDLWTRTLNHERVHAYHAFDLSQTPPESQLAGWTYEQWREAAAFSDMNADNPAHEPIAVLFDIRRQWIRGHARDVMPGTNRGQKLERTAPGSWNGQHS